MQLFAPISAALCAATAMVGVPATAAHAEAAPSVVFNRQIHVIPLDYGWLVEVECNATADPGSVQHVPVATAVSCALDDVTRSRAVPGHEAIVTVTSATVQDLTFCIWGEAAFVDAITSEALTVNRGPECETLEL